MFNPDKGKTILIIHIRKYIEVTYNSCYNLTVVLFLFFVVDFPALMEVIRPLYLLISIYLQLYLYGDKNNWKVSKDKILIKTPPVIVSRNQINWL